MQFGYCTLFAFSFHLLTLFGALLCRLVCNVIAVGTLYYHDFVVNFPRHGVVNYGLEFIFALPRRSNYVLLLEPFKSLREAFNENGEEIVTYVAAFRKVTDEPFMSFQEFQELPGLINIFEQYGLYRRVVSLLVLFV